MGTSHPIRAAAFAAVLVTTFALPLTAGCGEPTLPPPPPPPPTSPPPPTATVPPTSPPVMPAAVITTVVAMNVGGGVRTYPDGLVDIAFWRDDVITSASPMITITTAVSDCKVASGSASLVVSTNGNPPTSQSFPMTVLRGGELQAVVADKALLLSLCSDDGSVQAAEITMTVECPTVEGGTLTIGRLECHENPPPGGDPGGRIDRKSLANCNPNLLVGSPVWLHSITLPPGTPCLDAPSKPPTGWEWQAYPATTIPPPPYDSAVPVPAASPLVPPYNPLYIEYGSPASNYGWTQTPQGQCFTVAFTHNGWTYYSQPVNDPTKMTPIVDLDLYLIDLQGNGSYTTKDDCP